MLDLFLQNLILHKGRFKKQINISYFSNIWFFNVSVMNWKFLEIVYNIWVRFNFLLNYNSYTLQKRLIQMILQIKTAKKAKSGG